MTAASSDWDPDILDAATLVNSVATQVTTGDDLITRCVVAIDDLFPDASPAKVNEIMRAVRAIGEQFDAQAAQSEKVELDDELAELSGQVQHPPRRGHVDLADLPPWLRLGILATRVAWATNRCRTCMHAPLPTGPDPVTAVCWSPGLLVCMRRECQRIIPKHPDHLCDHCRDPIVGGCWISIGNLIFMIALCGRCQASIAGLATGPVYFEDDD